MEHPPTLSYAMAPRPRAAWWPVAVPLVLLMVTPMFMCACGHLDAESLMLTVPTLGTACYGWATTTARFPWRLIHIAVVLVVALQLVKNVGDVLLFGHNPLLG